MSDSAEFGERSIAVDPAQAASEARAISRSAFMVMLGGMFSVGAGFVNQMILAAYFGAGVEMDCYLTALVIPTYVWAVSLSGLSFVVIPAFVREKTRGNEDAAWELAGTFFWVITGVLTAAAILGSVYSARIISLTAPGFSPEKTALAARMLSVLMFSAPLTGLSSYTIGIQNANGRFFWPAFGGAVNSIGSVLGLVLLTRFIGPMALPYGFLLAIFLQSCVTVVPVLRHGWRRLIPMTDSRVLEMARLLLPFIVFGLLARGTGIFERYFASALPNGQISYLGYAGKISNIFQMLLATGLAAAIFPAMAKTYAQDGNTGLAEKTSYGVRLTFAVGLPAILITGALSVLVVRAIYERGEFHSADTEAVARVVLLSLTSGAFCFMLSNVISRAFYVLKDTLSPPLISALGVITYVCIGRYFASRWGYVGLAYASLIQQVLFVATLYLRLSRKLPAIARRHTWGDALAYGLAALWAFLIARLASSYLVFLPSLLNLATSALLSAFFYLGVLYIYDREIAASLLEMFGVPRIPGLIRNATRFVGQGFNLLAMKAHSLILRGGSFGHDNSRWHGLQQSSRKSPLRMAFDLLTEKSAALAAHHGLVGVTSKGKHQIGRRHWQRRGAQQEPQPLDNRHVLWFPGASLSTAKFEDNGQEPMPTVQHDEVIDTSASAVRKARRRRSRRDGR